MHKLALLIVNALMKEPCQIDHSQLAKLIVSALMKEPCQIDHSQLAKLIANALMKEFIIQESTRSFTISTCILAIKRDKRISIFVIGASSADEQKCEISCRLGDGPKDEDTVDPDSIIPSHCSIKNGGNISRNTTWIEVNDKLTLKPGLQCLVLKSGNSVKRIFFASKCYNGQNSSPNEYFVDPKVADRLGSTPIEWGKHLPSNLPILLACILNWQLLYKVYFNYAKCLFIR